MEIRLISYIISFTDSDCHALLNVSDNFTCRIVDDGYSTPLDRGRGNDTTIANNDNLIRKSLSTMHHLCGRRRLRHFFSCLGLILQPTERLLSRSLLCQAEEGTYSDVRTCEVRQ